MSPFRRLFSKTSKVNNDIIIERVISMNSRKITKISTDRESFFDVTGTIDIKTRIINLIISFDVLNRAFNLNCAELIMNPEKLNTNKVIYLCDENGIYYSCFNCIFGFTLNEELKIYSSPIEYILENILTDERNIKINELVFRTSMPKKYSLYISNVSFKYDKGITINIKRLFIDDKVIIDFIVSSSQKYKYNELSNIIYTILEMTFLYLGDIPSINQISIFNGQKIKLYIENAPKYIQRKNIYRSSTNGILSYIEPRSISKKQIKTFKKFRKQTKIIFDLLMINMNGDSYVEIKNSMLVQLLEGLYKTINTGVKIELWQILESYFLQNREISTLLVRRDLRTVADQHNTPIFLFKAKEHRHYLSHLNMNEEKNVFYKLENIYANWKLNQCIRIYIMQLIGTSINNNEFEKTKASIEKWAKEHKFRYKK